MKKIKLSVAALAIATSSFGQNVLSREDSSLLAKLEIENTAEDMIEWIIEDVFNGRIYQIMFLIELNEHTHVLTSE